MVEFRSSGAVSPDKKPVGRPRKDAIPLKTETVKNADVERMLKEAIVEERREEAVDRVEVPPEPESEPEKLEAVDPDKAYEVRLLLPGKLLLDVQNRMDLEGFIDPGEFIREAIRRYLY